MNRNLVDLFYWSWTKAFFSVISPRQSYEDMWLFEKWKQTLFLKKMDAEVFPSYNFWAHLHNFLINYPKSPRLIIKKYEKAFSEAPEDFLRARLVDTLPYWKYFPQIFRDLYKFYPKYDITFSEVEFVYLDYFFQLPKVFDSLLSELLVRDSPFLEPLPAKGGMMFYDQEVTFPIRNYPNIPHETFYAYILYFLSGEEPENYFFKVITLYLNARPAILAECTKELLNNGLEISDLKLAQYFLGYYIFKGVSMEALKFIVANLNLKNKNPFKAQREAWILKWESFSEETRQEVTDWGKEALEEMRKEVEEAAAQTHEAELKVLFPSLKKP